MAWVMRDAEGEFGPHGGWELILLLPTRVPRKMQQCCRGSGATIESCSFSFKAFGSYKDTLSSPVMPNTTRGERSVRGGTTDASLEVRL